MRNLRAHPEVYKPFLIIVFVSLVGRMFVMMYISFMMNNLY